MFPESELETIVAEYGSYFPSIKLTGSPAHGIELHTIEGNILHIKVSASGWNVVNSPQIYETFEALMNTKSPGFQRKFADDLFSRLQQLDPEGNQST